MNLNALDLVALELYKVGIRAEKKKYNILYEENYKEIAKKAYEEAMFFINYSNKIKNKIHADIENIS